MDCTSCNGIILLLSYDLFNLIKKLFTPFMILLQLHALLVQSPSMATTL